MTFPTPVTEDALPVFLIPPNTPQRRWTVLLRLILMIPIAIWTLLVGIAVFFAAIGGWLGAMAMGRLPIGIANFLEGAVNLGLRVYSYGWLLTDTYPAFGLQRPAAPGEFHIVTSREPLNRAAVFFRIFLVIPAGILGALATEGLQVLLFFFWLITLVTGREPEPIRNASTALLRWVTRTNAYFLMLTPTYPAGFFGDLPQLADTGWPAPPVITPYGAPVAAPAAEAGEGPVGMAAPLAEPVSVSSEQTSLVLSTGAKVLLVVFIILGLVGYIGSSALRHRNEVNAANARATIETQFSTLRTGFSQWDSQIRACKTALCVAEVTTILHNDLVNFADQLDATAVPRAEVGDRNAVVDDARGTAVVAAGLVNAQTNETTIRADAVQLIRGATQIDSDYQTLISAL